MHTASAVPGEGRPTGTCVSPRLVIGPRQAASDGDRCASSKPATAPRTDSPVRGVKAAELKMFDSYQGAQTPRWR